MNKAGKILLYTCSLLPAVWAVLILICAYFYFKPNELESFFVWSAVFYFFAGLWLWLLLLIVLKWRKKISWRETALHISITAASIFLAYLALHFDVFAVCGAYLDGSPP